MTSPLPPPFSHQGSQSSLDTVIENLARINLGKAKHKQCFLYMASETAKMLLPSLVDEKDLAMGPDKLKPM